MEYKGRIFSLDLAAPTITLCGPRLSLAPAHRGKGGGRRMGESWEMEEEEKEKNEPLRLIIEWREKRGARVIFFYFSFNIEIT